MRLKGKELFINIHTHHTTSNSNYFELLNLFPNQLEGCKSTDYQRFSSGVHPWHIVGKPGNEIALITQYLQHVNFVAIGEIGLDKARTENLEEQLTVFEEQLKLAANYHKPVIIHCVKAYSELLAMRKKHPSGTWIIHDFNSNDYVAGELIRAGCYLSFGRNFRKEGSRANRYFEFIPTDKIFLETDDDNTISISDVYTLAADKLAMPLPELQQRIIKNFNTVFDA